MFTLWLVLSLALVILSWVIIYRRPRYSIEVWGADILVFVISLVLTLANKEWLYFCVVFIWLLGWIVPLVFLLWAIHGAAEEEARLNQP
jgi:hypothetical protein